MRKGFRDKHAHAQGLSLPGILYLLGVAATQGRSRW
jgi:hypothetical protein